MKVIYLCLLISLGCNQTKTSNSQIDEKETIDSVSDKPSAIDMPRKSDSVKTTTPVMSDKDEILSKAVAISNDFYNCLLKQNYQGANAHLHKDALSETTTTEWIEIYKKAQTKTGRLGYVKMVDHGAKANIDGGNGKGDYAELIFDTQYKDGNLREKLIFFRKDKSEELKILGYEYHAILTDIKLSEILK